MYHSIHTILTTLTGTHSWDIYVTVSFIFENRMSKEQWLSPEKIFDIHNFSLKLAVFVVSRELFPLDILFFPLGKLCP